MTGLRSPAASRNTTESAAGAKIVVPLVLQQDTARGGRLRTAVSGHLHEVRAAGDECTSLSGGGEQAIPQSFVSALRHGHDNSPYIETLEWLSGIVELPLLLVGGLDSLENYAVPVVNHCEDREVPTFLEETVQVQGIRGVGLAKQRCEPDVIRPQHTDLLCPVLRQGGIRNR